MFISPSSFFYIDNEATLVCLEDYERALPALAQVIANTKCDPYARHDAAARSKYYYKSMGVYAARADRVHHR